MEIKTALAAFATLFLAEIGDKTQLAVITMSASTQHPWSVFIGAALGLVAVTAVGAVFGRGIVTLVPEAVLHRVVATAFIAVGAWMWLRP